MSTSKRRKDIRRIPLLGVDVRYLNYLRRFGSLLAISCVLILAVAGLDILAPWPIKLIVDNVIGTEPLTGPVGEWLARQVGTDRRALAAFLGLSLLGITLLQGVVQFGYEYMNGLIQERSTFRLRSDVFRHVQNLSVQFFDQNRQGDLLKRVTDDSGRIMGALVNSVGEFLVDAIKFTGFALVMVFVNWRFSLIVLAYVPFLLFVYVSFRQKIRETAKEARTQEGEMMNLALETLGAIREVKAFGREEHQQAEFDSRGIARIRSALRSVRWEASFSPAVDFVQASSTAAVIWYGVSQVLVDQLSVGALLLFMAYLKDIYRPLRHFSRLTANLQKAAVSGDRLGKLLDADVDIKDAPHARSLGRSRGELVFQGVSFAYSSAPDHPILADIDLTVPGGQKVAFVGKTGAGKSTLASLPLRFYDVSAGRILIDGMDLRDVYVKDLRRQFALVSQDPVLFARSVWENIAYGRLDVSEAEIVEAARAAHAHEFILRLPEGYDTVLGHRGSSLSGGQRQRIAIARALIRDAPILILDEPTAALDAASEGLVMAALDRLMAGRTTLIIAHRLSTIQAADRIVVLDRGRIVEQGDHASLMQLDGHYARLVRLQTGLESPTLALAASFQAPDNRAMRLADRPARQAQPGNPLLEALT